MEVRVGPDHIVLDGMGTQLPHKGHSSLLNFGRCLGGTELSSNLRFVIGPFRDHNPNGMTIDLAVFAQVTAECPYTLLWAPLSPKLLFPMGNLDPPI